MPPQDPEATRWFLAQLQPHEAQLRAWLASQFSTHQDIDDVVQEAFVRVLHTRNNAEVRSPKAFLFVIARNLVLMRLRHSKVAREDSLAEIDCTGIQDEGADVPSAVARAQEIEMLTEAIQSLPTRCRQILTLRKIYGMSQKETASELGIVEHTVEVQTAIGLKKIGQYFRKFRVHD